MRLPTAIWKMFTVDMIRPLEKQFYEFMDTHYPEIGREIKTTGKLDDATEEKNFVPLSRTSKEAREIIK